MRLFTFFLVCSLALSACKKDNGQKPNLPDQKSEKVTLKYAKGFSITNYESYKEIVVTSPWPKSQDTFRYILSKEGHKNPEFLNANALVQLPVENVVVMSTTNIPTLEYLNIDNKLVGFPNTKFISSEKTRSRIDTGEIKDLNSDLDLNMELLIDLQPDLVVGFSVNGNNKTLNQIEKFEIPVVLDGAWTEKHPLGRAEWIKFIAAFFNKEKEADSIFNTIESSYLKAKELAANVNNKPVVFSGSMFKDVWNVPGGKSFVAKYLEDANVDYLWKDSNANGSLQLNFENVLDKAQGAQFWIGAGSFQTKSQMIEQHKGYSYFEAFKTNNIYTYTNKIGPGGGLLYYELGPLRPDLILKDIINIAHPNLLEDYNNFFFKRLD
ncbi:ABC transporter substrate-binding protein [Seonamhaeicola marinus]|uniref:ABC transporter substrate-binding protein n=1 Tax=Seonamhaeicola marinus TaxID=1912246 RepID=A0A5D0JAT8_9FLAO|nr:ABC transporter substrate-binding protein [Seonamhaeicola marinus]TYA92230.1 ABC transporter substrate-binding protein [Seonamhaeicola marinus]